MSPSAQGWIDQRTQQCRCQHACVFRKGPDISPVPLKEGLLGFDSFLLCCGSLQLQRALLQVFLLRLSCHASHIGGKCLS